MAQTAKPGEKRTAAPRKAAAKASPSRTSAPEKPGAKRPKSVKAYNRDAAVTRDASGRRTVAQRRAGSGTGARRLPLLLGAAVVLIALTAGAVWMLGRSADKEPSQALQAPPASSQPTEQTQPSTEPAPPVAGTDILAQYSSENHGGHDRTVNLELACAALNGTVVDVDEEFSFNRAVGERTPEKGYLPASIYSDGNIVPEVGGGICQVASTLYLVALKADLEIVERRCHQFTVDYLPLGMDAAIYWGSLDFRFRNTSGAPIRILANTENDCVNITIEGTKSDGGSIRMEYEILETYEPDEKTVVDKSQEPGYEKVTTTPITGFLVQTYYCYYDADGALLERVPCALSDYDKRDQVTTVGPEQETEPETEPETESEQNPEDIPETEPPPTETPSESESTAAPEEPTDPTGGEEE